MSLQALGNAKIRVVIKFLSNDIPGEISRRYQTLIDAFSSEVLGRNFQDTKDYAHIPPGFDAEHETCWLVLDLNVGERGVDCEDVPVYYYKARYNGSPNLYVCAQTLPIIA